MSKEQQEALESAGIGGLGSKLFLGFIRILMKKAGPALMKNGYTGISILAFVGADGSINPTMNLHKPDGTKTQVKITSDDVDEAEEEALKQLEENSNA